MDEGPRVFRARAPEVQDAVIAAGAVGRWQLQWLMAMKRAAAAC